MKTYVLGLIVGLGLSMGALAQETPKACCSDKKTEQTACAEKTPDQKEAFAEKPAEGAKSCCAEPVTKKERCAQGEGQAGAPCCGACKKGANEPRVSTGYRIQSGQVQHGEASMHRMHPMSERTEMSVDTIVSGDSTKVIVRVMKRTKLAEGENLEDVMIHLDGLDLPEGAFSGEPHAFMFKGDGMGSDLLWNEVISGVGNTFFKVSDKGILGVKLEKREDIQGAFVVEVIPSSTAAALGLKTGDIIVAVDGQTVFSEESMMAEMAAKFTGDPIEIRYRRDGKKKKASGFLIPSAPTRNLRPQGAMIPAMPNGSAELKVKTEDLFGLDLEDVQISEEDGENGEKRVKVIIIKKVEN